jgi:hypothetical protein
MFEPTERVREELARLLDSLRELGGGRYAALFDSRAILLESPAEGSEGEWVLRRFLKERAEALFRVPGALRAGGEMEDLFADWEEDEFLLAVVNGRVAILVACPDAERLEEESPRLLKILVDRLLRLYPTYRLDEKGRGLFFGRPRLDTVVIGRPSR